MKVTLEGNTMNRILTTLCVIFALITTANAGDLYRCDDRNGNVIVTTSPQDGMENCVLQESYEDAAPKEQAAENKNITKEKEKASETKEDTDKERQERIMDCTKCCSGKMQACYNYTADSRLCAAENENCVATCDSEGASSSSWSECWSQSKK